MKKIIFFMAIFAGTQVVQAQPADNAFGILTERMNRTSLLSANPLVAEKKCRIEKCLRFQYDRLR